MKIIRPYSRLLPLPGDSELTPQSSFTESMGIELMRRIEWSARISHRSEDSATESSWKSIIWNVVMKHGDWSVVEHAVVSVDTVVDRGITHEWVRHRLFGFTQESTRFVNYEKKMPPSFIYPQVGKECQLCLEGVELKHGVNCFDASGGWYHCVEIGNYPPCAHDKYWLCAIESAEREYRNLLSEGWRPQEARSVFPNALASRIITTGNLRNWRHFLIMRTCAEAHPQMRQVTIPLLKEFQTMIPLLFDDITPNQKQSEAMKKAR